MFKPVPKDFDIPQLESEVLRFWEENDVERLYISRNSSSEETFRFLDGPITANGPMGVHHAWGRTYKDVWQRYNTMLGKRQRYQNGFDCQGLWVEVIVERELGFKSKRDIEAYGIAEFVRKCKESVFHYADLMTRQSRRLGYFMDWDNSYYTLSDENNYAIWHFLKTCYERGLIYEGIDSMPWCPRCGTGLSDHEVAEGYQEVTHQSVYVRFPLRDRVDESLLVWTTTPWTLPANVAVAVDPDLTYLKVRQGNQTFYVAKGAVGVLRGSYQVQEELPGRELLGLRYQGPFAELPAAAGADYTIIEWADVSEAEGTGLVHIAPGCGKEDFALSKKLGLKVIAPLDQNGIYVQGFDWLSGRSAQDVANDVVEDLEAKSLLYRAEPYTHRYPTCWRCGTELVFRVVDEWFISMDPLREPMMDVARRVKWIPDFCLERELDWLRNMDDWMISKKRYWGLALPFWLCSKGHLQVIGSKAELFEKALSGVEHLESPHRPWIDEVKLPCPECGEVAQRIADVGNPWLDAGVVPFSTLKYDSDRDYWRQWFPAEFITEGFPGQFRNWFYSLLAMSTVLEGTNPFETVLGYASVRDENGREMHKSWGNLIPFDEAADRAGADLMRWLFCRHNIETDVHFGWGTLDEVKRRFLVLWNTHSFFVTYANVDGWTPSPQAVTTQPEGLLDRWILARLHLLIRGVREGLDRYDAMNPARDIEGFIEDLSSWYVRRSRRRFWKEENDGDKLSAYATLYECLTTLARLLTPFMPFLAETFYQNLVREVVPDAMLSVSLTAYPVDEERFIDEPLMAAMEVAKTVVALGRAARERANLKIRQPLDLMRVKVPGPREGRDLREVEDIILEELNVKRLELAGPEEEFVQYSVLPNLPALGPRYGKLLPKIRAALEKLPADQVVQTIEQGEAVTLQLDGQTVQLEADDLLLSTSEREGFAAMGDGGYLVALDTQLTPELIREGQAREIVRRVNDWRREAGMNVQDRINVRYQASPGLTEAIEQYREYVARETLATSVQPGSLDGKGFKGEARLGSEWLKAQLQAER